jgi:hypothetical protein
MMFLGNFLKYYPDETNVTHTINITPLKPFTGWMELCLNPNEKSMFLGDTMYSSSRTQEIEPMLDTSGSPCGIFLFKPNNSLFQ